MTLHCPAPELIVRVVHGDGTPDEIAGLETHAAGCAECRMELEALRGQGSPESWSIASGSDGALPESLWRRVLEARPPAGLAFRVRIGAALDPWIRALTGGVDLHPLSPAMVRGPAAESSRVRAVAGGLEMLLRRGPDRLTLVMTERGVPAEGLKLHLTGDDFAATGVTDSSGAATFRDLPGGDYRLDVEGMTS